VEGHANSPFLDKPNYRENKLSATMVGGYQRKFAHYIAVDNGSESRHAVKENASRSGADNVIRKYERP